MVQAVAFLLNVKLHMERPDVIPPTQLIHIVVEDLPTNPKTNFDVTTSQCARSVDRICSVERVFKSLTPGTAMMLLGLSKS
jgi:hypothetical protein